MRIFALTFLLVIAAGCAGGIMQTAEERQQGICEAEGKVAAPIVNRKPGIAWHCVEAPHDR